MNTRQGALLLVFASLPLVLLAQEPGLYGAEADESAALIRVLNATSQETLESVRIGPTRLEPVELFSSYRAIRTGIYIAAAGGGTVDVVAEGGLYSTIVVTDDGLRVHRDPRHDDPARAQLILYAAAAPDSVSLVTGDGAVTVIPSVEVGESAEVVVNAVSVELAIVTEDEIVGVLDSLALQRGQSYGIAVLPRERSSQVRWEQATLE
jgi:hypothetical protein